LFRCFKPLLLLFVPCISGPRGCALCPLSPSVVTSALHQAPRSLDPLPAGLSVPTHTLVLAIEWSSFTCGNQLCWLFVSQLWCLTLCPLHSLSASAWRRTMGTRRLTIALVPTYNYHHHHHHHHHHHPQPPLAQEKKKTLPGAPPVLATCFWVPSMRRPALPPPTSQPPSSALRHSSLPMALLLVHSRP
jgi:hypothetical protein